MNTKAMVAIVTGVVIIGGAAAWFIFNPNVAQNNDSANVQQGDSNTPQVTTETPQSPATDKTEVNEVQVSIKNFQYAPSNITVKKGTTVVWTNEDGTGHNVVSNSDAPAGGPPTAAPLLGKNQQFTFTYDVVGTFGYHCTPHPNMTGQVTVIE